MKKLDIILIGAILLLSLFGLMMVYSSSNVWADYKFGDSFKYLKAQGLFVALGFVLMMVLSKISYQYYYNKANIILGICFILLLLVIIPGIGVVRNGSRSWFGVGGFGIQPSEFAKIALIIFVSKYLSKIQNKRINIKRDVFPVLIIALMIFIIIMLQPDFGTGFILLVTFIGLLFASNVKLSFFIKMGLLGVVAFSGLIVVAPYRLERILSFLDPWKDPLGSGFQAIQSLYAIGPGGLLGLGLGNSIQKHFYLPEPQTDFIFSIIAEELGFIGVLVVLFLFAILVIRGFHIALQCEDLFGKYLAFGITFGFAFQTLLNLMVVTSVLPITGVTLPFLSYGGSSLLITMIGMGILLNISRHQERR